MKDKKYSKKKSKKILKRRQPEYNQEVKYIIKEIEKYPNLNFL